MEQQYFINMLQILDASVERGTWKGPEIEGIAGLRKQTMEQIKNLTQEKEESQVESITKKIGEK